MAEQLSQADIDALLDTFSSEGGTGQAAARPKAPRPENATPYDFSHPDLLSREQERALRTLHEGFAQSFAKRLSTELLADVTATISAVDHLTYGEFLLLLPTPTVLAVVQELPVAIATRAQITQAAAYKMPGLRIFRP